ncbi:hypothetical protein BDK51DRAFT_40559 [Blyttiomyces helicus]|uniref:Protein HGH1 homolog n=1 Tax=Blyttiomyces helicus TaxID=388810 RepID=A0A4P9W7X3_9FUNG|nr:hypothetical protein BDK51DRAFT_40559 [Blyttiomyces helicus]|eukprot:RKO87495.1 hypothetical protein BDK51DRAFT_40559 [Blyttiomyces helicus]
MEFLGAIGDFKAALSDGEMWARIACKNLPRNVLADLCCMLLNNLTESASIAQRLVPQTPLNAASPSAPTRTHQLDNLLEVFVRGAGKTYNPNAEYHFLAGVFANVTATGGGSHYMLRKSGVDGVMRLAKVLAFTEHPNRIRRHGAVATLKNCAFDPEGHGVLLEDSELNLLPYLLLPLSGPEDYTDEEMDGMPDELQLLESDKSREPDDKIRLSLVETLVLLTTTRPGRDILRAKKVYSVVKKLHLVETDDAIREAIERLVDMLQRDEAPLPVDPVEPPRKERRIMEVSDDEEEEGEEDAVMGELA